MSRPIAAFWPHLGEAKRLKAPHPDRVVGVGGAGPSRSRRRSSGRFPFVDVAFGPGQVHKLAEFLVSDSLTSQGFFEFEGFTGRLPAKRERPFQAWMQISVGLQLGLQLLHRPVDPGARGLASRRGAGGRGRGPGRRRGREVTLLGQNVNSYGRDLRGGERTSFAGLLELIDAVEGSSGSDIRARTRRTCGTR